MSLQRIFNRLLGRPTSKTSTPRGTSSQRSNHRGKRSRGLRLESLHKRELLASDLGAIGGTVFLDANDDGNLGGAETALANVRVTLYRDLNASGDVGTFDVNDTVVGSLDLNQAAGGEYLFKQLDGADADGVTTSGIYFLEVTELAGGATDTAGNPVANPSLPSVQTITLSDTDDDGVTQQTIDGFQANQTGLPSVLNSATSVQLSSGTITGVIGGERDVEHTWVSDSDITPSNSTFSVVGNQAIFENGVGVTATLKLQYDGLDADDGALVLDEVGLRAGGVTGVDLSNGDDAGGLLLSVNSDQIGSDFVRIRVFTDAAQGSEAFIDFNGVATDVFVPFADFVAIGGLTAADFTDVGAIEAEILQTNGAAQALPEGLDFTLSVVESRISSVTTVNAAVITPLVLGGEVFIDNGGGNNAADQNNGLRENLTEALVDSPAANQIIVQLFDTDPAVGNPTPIATTVVQSQGEAAPGTYEFTTLGVNPVGGGGAGAPLGPGTYFVVIPEGEFDATGPLNGFIGSQIDTPNGDTDDDVDNDNDGVSVANLGFVSGAITLTIGGEPSGGGSTNTTVDFGVVPVTDLRVDKTILNDVNNPNDLSPGGTVRFSVTVTNLGVNDATQVVVSDLVPAGLTITSVQDSGGNNQTLTATTVNGQAIRSFNVGTVQPGAGNAQTFTVIADIDANISADPTNVVEVTGYEVEDDIDTTDADRAAGDPVQGALENNTAIELVDIPLATLSVTKTDSLTTTTAGSQITYTIVVTNTSTDPANNVTALDTLPTGLTFVSGTFTDGNGTVVEGTPGQILATLGTLAAGEDETFTIVADVDPNLLDGNSPLSNSVTATADNAPDVTSTDDTTVTRLTDVTVGKVVVRTRTPDDRTDNDDNDDIVDTTAPFDVFAGGFVTYQITATNTGPSVARGVVVTDTLDDGLTLVAGSFDAGSSGVGAPTVNGQLLTFTIPDLAPGQPQVFTFEVAIGSNELAAIDNVVNITTTDPESNSNNNSGTVSIDPEARVDLILDKSVAPVTVVPGQGQVVYTFTVSHDTDSISDAINVDVTDTLPAGLTGVTISETGNDITNSSFNVNTRQLLVEYASIPVGQTRTFTVTATVNNDATGTIVNTAAVTVPGVTELDTTNNSDSATITLTPQFDLQVTKTVNGSATLGPLDNVTYTIVVSHDLNDDGTEADNGQSPSLARDVVLTDVLPAGLTFTSATVGGAAVTPTNTNGTLVFPSFDLAPGTTQTYTITASINDDSNGVLTNNVSFVTATGETDTTNNSATADITVVPQANVRVAKTVSATTAQSGTQLTYTITVNNDGPSPAQAVTAVDTLPSGLTFVSGTGPTGQALSANGQTVTVNGGTLAASGANSSFQFTIIAQVNAGATVDQVNTVTVSTSTTETNANDNSATATTAIDQAINELSGRIFRDFNNDGLFNGIDSAIAGVELLLTGGDLSAAGRRAITDAQGNYRFDDLIAGTYSVQRLTEPEYTNDGLEKAGVAATPADLVNETIEVIVGGAAPASAPENDFALVPFISYKLCII